MRERGVELARRRGGGGAVYLEPARQLWVDAWIRGTTRCGWPMSPARPSGWANGGRTPWRRAGAARLRRPRRPRRARRVRGAGVLRRPWVRARCSTGGARWSASRSGGPARARCSPRAPTCDGIPGRCSSCCTWTSAREEELGRGLTQVAVGLRELEPAVAELGAVRDDLLASFATPGTRRSRRLRAAPSVAAPRSVLRLSSLEISPFLLSSVRSLVLSRAVRVRARTVPSRPRRAAGLIPAGADGRPPGGARWRSARRPLQRRGATRRLEPSGAAMSRRGRAGVAFGLPGCVVVV